MKSIWSIDRDGPPTAPLITVRAPAKLNLTLRVLDRRPDGYHLLDSIVGFVDLHDTLTLRPATKDSLVVTGPFADRLTSTLSGNDDLAFRALQAVRKALAPPDGKPDWFHRGVAIHVEKRIPLGAGLGGGSADAAAVLRALRSQIEADACPDLAALGLTLGADVPVCLSGAAQRMTGIGDVLSGLPALPPLGVVLCHPGRPVPTAEVFAAVKGRYSEVAPPFPDNPGAGDLLSWLREFGRNDLAQPSEDVDPSGGRLHSALEQLPGAAYTAMTGSGAVRYALFQDRAAADRALIALRQAEPSLWSEAATLLP